MRSLHIRAASACSLDGKGEDAHMEKRCCLIATEEHLPDRERKSLFPARYVSSPRLGGCDLQRLGLTHHQAMPTKTANPVYATTNTHQGASQYSSLDSQCSMKLSR